MKRASYRDGVRWIAENDSAGEEDALDPVRVGQLITAVFLAELFDVDSDRVGQDVVRARKASARAEES